MLFQWGNFKSAAGLDLDWKLECDALNVLDWHCIANAAVKYLPPFGGVFGIPRGGQRLVNMFAGHIREDCKMLLVVGDVWTTGKSMRAWMDGSRRVHSMDYEGWHGFVAFARGPLDDNVRCFAKIEMQ